MSRMVTESEFYMWRTLFAIAHADNVVTKEEIRFMVEVLEDIPFTDQQREVLTNDISDAQDIAEMFKGVTDPGDQARFFKFAHELVWVDGDYGKEEQDIMLKLKEAHIRNTDVDKLIGNIDLEFDEGVPPRNAEFAPKKREPREVVFSFREQFFRDLNKKHT